MLSKTVDYWLFRAYKKILSNSKSNTATVLIFHRVKPGQHTGFDEYTNAEEFRFKMVLLKKYFNVISLPTLIALKKKNEIPPLSVVISIDDGYEDGYSIITPILDELNISGAFFIATQGVESGGLWNDRISEVIMKTDRQEVQLFKGALKLKMVTLEDRLASWRLIHNKCKFLTLEDREEVLTDLESKLAFARPIDKFLSTNKLREMHDAGMTIGAHTHKHPILAVESDAIAFKEIKKSKVILEEAINSEVKYFAYPNGKFGRDFSHKHQKMVKELGFEAALTTDIGLVDNETDLMALPRYTPWDKAPSSFALRLCHHFYRLK